MSGAWGAFAGAVLTALLGSGGAWAYLSSRADRADKRAAQAAGAPVETVDRLAVLLGRVDTLTGQVADALARATAAEIAADQAVRSARRAEADTIAAVAYIRLMWRGILDGSVPPHPRIPQYLSHLLTDDDFPTGKE